MHDVPLQHVLMFGAWPDCSKERTCYPVNFTASTVSHMHTSEVHPPAGPRLLLMEMNFTIHQHMSEFLRHSTNHDPRPGRGRTIKLASAGLGSRTPGRNADDLLENPTSAHCGLEISRPRNDRPNFHCPWYSQGPFDDHAVASQGLGQPAALLACPARWPCPKRWRFAPQMPAA